MKDMKTCITVSIICRLLGFIAVFAFVSFMVYLTGSSKCLWLLFLLLTVDIIPVYEFKSKNSENNSENKGDIIDV